MQTEMGLRIHQLETELARTRQQLDSSDQELKAVRAEKEKIEADRAQEVAELKLKIDSMGLQYEHVLHDSLDKLMDKLQVAKGNWEDKSTYIQSRHKHTLLEFG